MKIVPGMGFHHLEVLHQGPSDPSRTTRWFCGCICGAETLVRSSALRSGHSQSCGCMGKARLERDKTYNAWSAMRQRCRNPNNPAWPNYGGRGISVAPEWDDFETFLREVGPAPSLQFSLDRKDHNGNYEPGNVRWASSRQQARNRRSNCVVEFNGVTQTLAAWSEQTGISRAVLQWRLKNWDIPRALTTPVKSRRAPRRAAEDKAKLITRAETEVEAARTALRVAEQRLAEVRA